MNRGRAIAIIASAAEYSVENLTSWLDKLEDLKVVSPSDLAPFVPDGSEFSIYEALKFLGVIQEAGARQRASGQTGLVRPGELRQACERVSDHIAAMKEWMKASPSRREPTSELAWTLPGDLQVQTEVNRQSLAALIRQVVSSAEAQLYLLSPFLDDLGAKVLAGPMRGAQRRGVQIHVISHDLERVGCPNNVALAVFRSAAPQLRAYTAPRRDSTEKYMLLHAKLIVADRKTGVISSANLTQYGLKSHLELGVSVHGSDAKALQKLVESLISTGYVTRV